MAKTKNVKDQKDLINYVKDVAEKPKKTTKTSNKNTVKSNESKFVVKYTFNLKDYLTPDELANQDIYNEYVSQLTPKYAHPGDIGMDIVAIGAEYDDEYDRYIYHTGFYCESPESTGCFIMPRSSNSKTDAYLCNSVGLVDSFLYRGEFCLMFKNRTTMEQMIRNLIFEWFSDLPWYARIFKAFRKFQEDNWDHAKTIIMRDIMDNAPYKVGDRIGQLVWMKFPKVDMKLVNSVDDLSKTIRGAGGFGSTGK